MRNVYVPGGSGSYALEQTHDPAAPLHAPPLVSTNGEMPFGAVAPVRNTRVLPLVGVTRSLTEKPADL